MAVRSKTMSIRFLTLPLLFALFVYSPITIGGVDTGNYRPGTIDNLANRTNRGETLAGVDTGNYHPVFDIFLLVEKEWDRVFADTDFLALPPGENFNIALEEISEQKLAISNLGKRVACKEGLSFCVVFKSPREVVISFELSDLSEDSYTQYLLTYSLR